MREGDDACDALILYAQMRKSGCGVNGGGDYKISMPIDRQTVVDDDGIDACRPSRKT